IPDVYGTHINDVLLSALLLTLSQWTKSPSVRIDLEGHGREDIAEGVDVSRTVGWFTTLFPLTLRLPPSTSLKAVLLSVKEQLRPVPHRGIGHGLLRYLPDDTAVRARLASLPRADLVFNYLGRFEPSSSASPWRASAADTGPLRAASCRRSHAIEVNARI